MADLNVSCVTTNCTEAVKYRCVHCINDDFPYGRLVCMNCRARYHLSCDRSAEPEFPHPIADKVESYFKSHLVMNQIIDNLKAIAHQEMPRLYGLKSSEPDEGEEEEKEPQEAVA